MAILQTDKPSADISIAPIIARIRREFISTLTERCLTLEALKAEVTSSQNPERALFAIAEMAHKMAGVAGTLGLEQLGQVSAKLDEIIGAARSNTQAAAQTWRIAEDVFEDLLDEMEALLDQSES